MEIVKGGQETTAIRIGKQRHSLPCLSDSGFLKVLGGGSKFHSPLGQFPTEFMAPDGPVNSFDDRGIGESHVQKHGKAKIDALDCSAQRFLGVNGLGEGQYVAVERKHTSRLFDHDLKRLKRLFRLNCVDTGVGVEK